jgi:hypothetical protein
VRRTPPEKRKRQSPTANEGGNILKEGAKPETETAKPETETGKGGKSGNGKLEIPKPT